MALNPFLSNNFFKKPWLWAVIAVVILAAGGAYAGNMAEKKIRAETQYQIRVHFDNGGETTITQATLPAFGVGSAVRVVNGAVIPK